MTSIPLSLLASEYSFILIYFDGSFIFVAVASNSLISYSVKCFIMRSFSISFIGFSSPPWDTDGEMYWVAVLWDPCPLLKFICCPGSSYELVVSCFTVSTRSLFLTLTNSLVVYFFKFMALENLNFGLIPLFETYS